MATFNVDSLDFVDDEEVRTGDAQEFASRYSSSNDRLEIEDLTAGTVAHVPRGTSTDLVGGKFAETVSEGKALADDGESYDSIQQAVDSASSWVKVGPGTFNESVTIDTKGLTLEGSGERTLIFGTPAIDIQSSDLAIRNFSVKTPSSAGNTIDVGSNSGTSAINVKFRGSGSTGFAGFNAPDCTVINCRFSGPYPSDACIVNQDSVIVGCIVENSGQNGIKARGVDCVVVQNQVRDTDSNPFVIAATDSTVSGNISDSANPAVVTGNDIIFVNNRILNSSINDIGTGNIVQDNLVTQ